ncbi:MAG: hypothetical protein LC659_10425, partial [Myxococcales bacterium]|nr:hypothetical protein [Myxococcales bacterium]
LAPRGRTMTTHLAIAGMGSYLPRLMHTNETLPPLGLVRAMRPDITFVHALYGDEEGNAIFSPPYCESFWSAVGARVGVIVTVEKFVERKLVAAEPGDIKIPADRVLAICEAPFGTHPQPLFGAPRFGLPGYRDDFAHYERWRTIAQNAAELARFDEAVIAGDEEGVGDRYRRWVGIDRLQTLVDEATALQAGRPPARARVPTPSRPRVPTPVEGFSAPSRENEILLLLGARAIVERVLAKGYRTILAGIGHSFVASRLAKLWLAERGVDVKVMVETGLYDLECGPRGHEFPLAYDNIAQAKKLSSVEDVLGALTCGSDNLCLGVLGAGQIDERGDINSTRTASGKILVGSGGANDIAASAAEVVVLTRHTTSRLVPQVDYVTSRGRGVQTVVTNLAAFARAGERSWRLATVYPALGGRPIAAVLDAVKKGCPWPYEVPADLAYAPMMSTQEMLLLHTLEHAGAHWHREGGR